MKLASHRRAAILPLLLLVVVSLPCVHAWALPPLTTANKGGSSSSSSSSSSSAATKGAIVGVKSQGASSSSSALLHELTSSGGQLNVDFTVAPWVPEEQSTDLFPSSDSAFSSSTPIPALFYENNHVTHPPPILRAFPGDTIRVRVRSELPNNIQSGRDGATGLTLHGLRLTTATEKGGLFSRLAGPQLAIHTFTLTEDHAPGLHWYRIGGDLDFVGALYVLPPANGGAGGGGERRTTAAVSDASSATSSLQQQQQKQPTEQDYPTARLLLFHFQDHATQAHQRTYLVNGQEEHPLLEMRVGEGQVLDLAHASGPHLLEIEAANHPGCTMQLLALDGIDLAESREVSYVGLVPRQRARVLLICHETGHFALVARGSSDGSSNNNNMNNNKRNALIPASQKWQQLLVSLSVTKGLPFSRLPRLPKTHPHTHTHTANYLRDLVEADTNTHTHTNTHTLTQPSLLSSCSVSLFPCTRASDGATTSCPGGKEICPLSTPSTSEDEHAPITHSTLREIYITQTHPTPAASVRLSPAQPFQILEFMPLGKNHAQTHARTHTHTDGEGEGGEEMKENVYLKEWGRYGEWRDVLPPLVGTFRVRYLAHVENSQDDPYVAFDRYELVGEGVEGKEVEEGGDVGVEGVVESFDDLEMEEAERTYTHTHTHTAPNPATFLSVDAPPVKRKSLWNFPGYKRGGNKDGASTDTDTHTVVVEDRDAYLLVQATIGEAKRDPEWVESSIKEWLSGYLCVEKPAVMVADDDTMTAFEEEEEEVEAEKEQEGERDHRRALLSSRFPIPMQMPRRYLPGASHCNDSALVWPTSFTLHLLNSSSIYPVVNKLHSLLAEGGGNDLPQLCSVNVTLLSSTTTTTTTSSSSSTTTTGANTKAAAANGADSSAQDKNGGGLLQTKVRPRVLILVAFAGGACILLIAFLVARSFLSPGQPPRSSRRSSVHHDPTSIETQITELDDSTNTLGMGIKGHALRHNSRSRNNSLNGLASAAASFPPPRLSSTSSGNLAAGGVNGNNGSNTHRASGSTGGNNGSSSLSGSLGGSLPPHYRSSSSLPSDLGGLAHSRSSSMPHKGFGFLFPRRQSSSTESINISNSGVGAGSGLGGSMSSVSSSSGGGGGQGGK